MGREYAASQVTQIVGYRLRFFADGRTQLYFGVFSGKRLNRFRLLRVAYGLLVVPRHGAKRSANVSVLLE
jgi:hypothetical protein